MHKHIHTQKGRKGERETGRNPRVLAHTHTIREGGESVSSILTVTAHCTVYLKNYIPYVVQKSRNAMFVDHHTI